jgi:hypothetical protein
MKYITIITFSLQMRKLRLRAVSKWLAQGHVAWQMAEPEIETNSLWLLEFELLTVMHTVIT